MKPDYLSPDGRIAMFNCDCLDYMRGAGDKAFDLALVDPPYGIFGDEGDKACAMNWLPSPSRKASTGAGRGWGAKYPARKHAVGDGGSWDTKYSKQSTRKWDVAPGEDYFKELKRIAAHQIIFGANYFPYRFNNFVIWRKLTISETFSMSMAEIASVSLPGNGKVYACAPQDTKRFHPTQKPVALYGWLLRHYSQPQFRLFDSHSGSGTAVIAAHRAGNAIVACELDPGFFAQSVERVERELQQAKLAL